MGLYWQLFNNEYNFKRINYLDDKQRDIYDLAILAWETYISSNYFHFEDTKTSATLVLAYKSQADLALKQAIDSALGRQYPQAMHNIRFAIENLVIAMFAFKRPEVIQDMLANSTFSDTKIKRLANDFLDKELPERSKKFAALHDTFNKYGSHQGIGLLANSIRLREQGITLLYRPDDAVILDVGICGIVAGAILEFHFSVDELGLSEHINIRPEVRFEMKQVSIKFEELKSKYKTLFGRL